MLDNGAFEGGRDLLKINKKKDTTTTVVSAI